MTSYDIKKKTSLYLLTSLAIFSISATAVVTLMLYPAKPSGYSLGDFVGETLPYTLFAGIGGYYFARWALRHRKLAILIVGAMFLTTYGYVTYFAPKPVDLKRVMGASNETGLVEYITVNRTDVILGPNAVIPNVTRFQTPSPALVSIIIAVVEVAVILIVLIYGMLLPRLKGVQQLRQTRLSQSEVEESSLNFADEVRNTIVQYYKSAVHLVRRKGLQVRKSDTPRRLRDNVCTGMPQLCSDFGSLTDLLEEARFSLHSLKNEDRQKAGELYFSIDDCLKD